MHKPLHPISALIIKYLEGDISLYEKQELDKWIHESKENSDLFDDLCDEYQIHEDLATCNGDKKATWIKITARIPELEGVLARPTQWKWIRHVAAVAIVLLTVMSVWSFAFNRDHHPKKTAQTNHNGYKNDVSAPAGHTATLTLADGRTIPLDDVNSGQVAEQGTMMVVKQEDGSVEYHANPDVKSETSRMRSQTTTVYNTISTHKGGRHKIVLADNSVVWLNAASSLKYPTSFVGGDRVVELIGEGYFEIAKSPQRRRFIVRANGMQVEVLGTHFNIMSYPDESFIKATLLEGSVRVTAVSVSGGGPVARQSQLLSPGQQATLAEKSVTAGDKSPIQVTAVDTAAAIAWRNEVFIYNNAPIETIMREIARSYDVEIVYEGTPPPDKFNLLGVPRHVPISQVLRSLELTSKVKFDIEGRRITVKAVAGA